MIGLGLRLTFGAGREAVVRLAIVAAAVALGVGMLLSAMAALNATNTQNVRNAWLNTGRSGAQQPVPTGSAATASTASTAPKAPKTDPAWWMLDADYYEGRLIGRIDVAATGPHPPVPPGIPRLPGPGEYYASPAMAKLIASTPADQLADRYPGKQVGTIGDAALPGPDSLIVVIGHAPGDLAGLRNATEVTSIMNVAPNQCSGQSCDVGLKNSGMVLILSVVMLALILPIVILIGTATRLAATRREQRFAAMRLVGATPRQVSVASAVESSVAAVAGVAAGFAVFFAFRPALAAMNLTQTRFFESDLSLTAGNVLLVAIGVPIATAVSARIALRRVQISPLGVTRRQTPKPPRAWRVVPLLAGLLELAYFIGRDPKTVAMQEKVFVLGGFLVICGIVIAGPWLTMAGARLLVRFTNRPALLIAGRRLSDDPRAGYRAVSGLVLALCVMSGTVGIITTMLDERGLSSAGAAAGPTVIGDYENWNAGRPQGVTTQPSDALLAGLRAIPGVRGLTVIHVDSAYFQQPAFRKPGAAALDYGGGLAACSQVDSTPVFGTCRPGAQVAEVNSSYGAFGFQDADDPWPATWPTAAVSPEQLNSIPVQEIAVTTDGSAAAIERARTMLGNAFPGQDPPATIAENRSWGQKELNGYVQLANVVIMISFPIAGCSLAVAVAGGLSDRKRPFSLMRLTGVQLGVLRRVVLLESAAPLLAVSAVAIGTGFLGAHLFLKAQLKYSLHAPGGTYYAMVGGGLVVALAVIMSTLPLLKRISGPEVARND